MRKAPTKIFVPAKKPLSEEKKATIEFRQELGKQIQRITNIEEKISELFVEFDSNHDQIISLEELKQGLLRWGVKLNKTNIELLVKSFPGAEMADYGQFSEIMSFFIKIRNNFSRFDENASDTIDQKELIQFLTGFDYGFDPAFLLKFLKLFDTDKSGELDWQEMVELMLYVHYLHKLFENEDQSKDGVLAPAELQSLLRSLGMSLTVTEIEVFLERAASKLDSQMDFEKFVELLCDMKENLDVIRKEAAQKRKTERVARAIVPVERKLPVTLNYEKNLAEHLKKVQKILEAVRKSGKPFEDQEFPADAAHLFPTRKDGLRAVKDWKRIKDFGPDAAVFKDGIDQGDVKQGALGDCWFLSSLCVLAAHGTDTLKSLFLETYPEEGIIQCRFFKDNDWVFIVTDDRIPCGPTGKPAFGCCRDKSELWVPILEKCYAKLHGSFEAIESGSISDGLVDLTGESSETLDVKKEDVMWTMLKNNIDEGYLMGCAASAPGASVEMETPLGILMLHAYGILKVYEIEGFKLLKIRNPWGSHEWKGKWCDGSKEWTPSIMEKLQYTFEDDGTFFMEFSDFTKQFNKLFVLRILTDEIGTQWKRFDLSGEWKSETAGGCPNFPTCFDNPQYRVRVNEKSRVFVSLRQPCLRYKTKAKPQYKQAIGFTVWKKGDSSNDPKRTKTDLVCVSPFFSGREISQEFVAEANVDYVVVPSHFNPKEENPFSLLIYTLHPESLVVPCTTAAKAPSNSNAPQVALKGNEAATEELKGKVDLGNLTLESAWIKGKTAGGCTNEPTWRQSPQFILEVAANMKVLVSLKQLQKVDGKFVHTGFIVMKAEPTLKRKIQVSDIVLQTQFVNSQTNSSEVTLSPGAYNIFASTFHPNVENTFQLTISYPSSVKPVPKFYELTEKNDWIIQSFPSAWGPGKDGGCSNNRATWMQNPSFSLELSQKSTVKITIEANAPKSAIGYYVFTSNDGTKVAKMVSASPFVQGQKAVMVMKDWDLDPGKYIVLATTFEPEKHGEFLFVVYSDRACKVKPL